MIAFMICSLLQG